MYLIYYSWLYVLIIIVYVFLSITYFYQALQRRRYARRLGGELPPVAERVGQVLLDDNLMELTNGRPFPLKHRAKVSCVTTTNTTTTTVVVLLRKKSSLLSM